VVSGATFQWLRSPAAFFERVMSGLAPGGLLAFTTFGPRNLTEFRDLTGVGLSYPSLEALRRYLSPHGQVLQAEGWEERLWFETPRAVLRHLQQTGVNGAGEYRWTPQRLRAFYQTYATRFGGATGIPLTYHPMLVLVRRR
jgi:hypothetical protein